MTIEESLFRQLETKSVIPLYYLDAPETTSLPYASCAVKVVNSHLGQRFVLQDSGVGEIIIQFFDKYSEYVNLHKIARDLADIFENYSYVDFPFRITVNGSISMKAITSVSPRMSSYQLILSFRYYKVKA